jgi:hypothetical protein
MLFYFEMHKNYKKKMVFLGLVKSNLDIVCLYIYIYLCVI